MPGNVTGSIGINPVELNNAATESTLALLLQAVSKNKNDPALLAAINKMAAQAGIGSGSIHGLSEEAKKAAQAASIMAAKHNVVSAVAQDLTEGFVRTAKNLAGLTSNVLDGTLAAGQFFRALESLPLGLGKVAELFNALSQLQQNSLESYRKMSVAGVNFGGSLTTIRTQALELGMSLDQYSNMVAKNSSVFTLMGSNAETGAAAFQKVAKELRDSPINGQLMALGYSAEDVTNGLGDYIKSTGGAGKSQKELAQSAGEYMTELSALSKLTGQTREEQKKAADEAANDAAYQMALSKMTDAQKLEAAKGLATAQATGVKGAVEMYRAQVSGSAVWTEGMKVYQTTAPLAANEMNKLGNAVKNGTSNEKIRTEALAKAQKAQSDVVNSTSATMMQANNGYSKQVAEMTLATIKANGSGKKSVDDFAKSIEESRAAVAAVKGSEADQAAQVETAFKQLSLAVSTLLLPVVRWLTVQMNGLILAFDKGFIHGIAKMIISPFFWLPIAASFIAIAAAIKAKVAMVEAISGGGSKSGGGAGGAAKSTGKLAKFAGKSIPYIGSLLAAGLSIAEISSINDAEKAGTMKPEDASKAKAGAGGELGGSLAGGALGAVLGTLLLPGIGTAIGGWAGSALGGMAGRAAGEYIGSPSEKRAFGSFGSTGSLFENFGAKKSVELHGTEAVVTPDQMTKLLQNSAATGIGSLSTNIQQLNAMTEQMLRILSNISDNTKKNVDATKSLNGNLFAH